MLEKRRSMLAWMSWCVQRFVESPAAAPPPPAAIRRQQSAALPASICLRGHVRANHSFLSAVLLQPGDLREPPLAPAQCRQRSAASRVSASPPLPPWCVAICGQSLASPGYKPPLLPAAAPCRYVGPTATITLLPDGGTHAEPGLHRPPAAEVSDPRWGTYRQRGTALGIPIFAFDCVDQQAVQQAEHIVHSMLQGAEQATVATMVQGGAEVAVIGRHQATTDLPMYRHLRGMDCENGGGDYDEATRGLGGNPGDWVWEQQGSKEMAGPAQLEFTHPLRASSGLLAACSTHPACHRLALAPPAAPAAGNPTTSCGEENLLMDGDERYGQESILVHEFGHAVMDLGLHQKPLRVSGVCEKATPAAVAPGRWPHAKKCTACQESSSTWAVAAAPKPS